MGCSWLRTGGPWGRTGGGEVPSFVSQTFVGQPRPRLPPFCGCTEEAEAFTGGFSCPELVGKSNASLLSKNNSLERAVDWIFSHIDDLDAEAAMDISEGRSAADSISESVPVGPKVRDGPGSECLWEAGWASGV